MHVSSVERAASKGNVVDARGLHGFSYLKISGNTTGRNLFNDIVWRTMTRAKIQSITINRSFLDIHDLPDEWRQAIITPKF